MKRGIFEGSRVRAKVTTQKRIRIVSQSQVHTSGLKPQGKEKKKNAKGKKVKSVEYKEKKTGKAGGVGGDQRPKKKDSLRAQNG